VTLGLLPGGGGITRTVRMLGIQNAFVSVLSQGTRFKPAKAKEIGLVDECFRRSRSWCPPPRRGSRQTRTPTKSRGTRRATRCRRYFRRRRRWRPSCRRSRRCCASSSKARRCRRRRPSWPPPVEGAQVDFDTASRIESRYFASLVTGQVAKNMIQAFFFDLQAINAGKSRPDGIGKTPINKIGVLGAGMMGAGIAYVSAKAGYDVVLKDVARRPRRRARTTRRSWRPRL